MVRPPASTLISAQHTEQNIHSVHEIACVLCGNLCFSILRAHSGLRLAFPCIWEIGSQRSGTFSPDAGKTIPKETIQSESHEFSLRMFFLYIYIFFFLREPTFNGDMIKCSCSSNGFESPNCSEPWRCELISCKQINQQQEWQPQLPSACNVEWLQEPQDPLISLIEINAEDINLNPYFWAHTSIVVEALLRRVTNWKTVKSITVHQVDGTFCSH